MYKIKVWDDTKETLFWEYGFSRYILKKISFYMNDTDENGFSNYDIVQVIPIVFSLKTFKKCLQHKIISIKC